MYNNPQFHLTGWLDTQSQHFCIGLFDKDQKLKRAVLHVPKIMAGPMFPDYLFFAFEKLAHNKPLTAFDSRCVENWIYQNSVKRPKIYGPEPDDEYLITWLESLEQ